MYNLLKVGDPVSDFIKKTYNLLDLIFINNFVVITFAQTRDMLKNIIIGM